MLRLNTIFSRRSFHRDSSRMKVIQSLSNVRNMLQALRRITFNRQRHELYCRGIISIVLWILIYNLSRIDC